MITMHVPKSKLKPKLFEYLRNVESGDAELCITDHGEPVVKVISIRSAEDVELNALRGMVKRYVDPCEPVDVNWEVSA